MSDRDFDSGFGIGGLGHTPETTPADTLAAQSIVARTAKPVTRFTCEHCGRSFPRTLAMTSSSGTVCPDCYDEASY